MVLPKNVMIIAVRENQMTGTTLSSLVSVQRLLSQLSLLVEYYWGCVQQEVSYYSFYRLKYFCIDLITDTASLIAISNLYENNVNSLWFIYRIDVDD